MNKEQKKERRREQRLRAKQREIEKVEELEEEADSEVDVIEKDMYPEVAYESQPAPISFAELDEMRTAEEEAHAVMEVTCDTEMLVRNILRDPDMEPAEKVDAISNVTEEFASRIVVDAGEGVEKDIDLLQLEAIVAHERRSMSALEFVEDLAKEVVSYASRNKMSDDVFALIADRGGKRVRKYLIHDKAHVRNALARAAQMIKRGGAAASDARSALPKIHAAAKKMGIGSNMEKENNSILIEKDSNDHWRWVGWVSNNFIDWDGDIISENAHKEYIDWWEKNKDISPVFLSWHTPGTARKAPVDFMMFEKGFLIMSGALEEDEAAGLLRVQAQTDLGMSHGTLVFERDKKDPRVIEKYRMYEVSDLPRTRAANPFTNFETVVKEVGMDKVQYLAQILGSEEKANAFLEKTGLKQKQLQEAEVENKEITEIEPEVKPDVLPDVEEKPEDIVARVMKEMDVEGLNAFVMQAKEDHDKIPLLESLIKELQGSQEDKLAEVLTPPAGRFAWSQDKRASQSEDNVVTDEEKKKSAPGVPEGYWLSDLSKTVPIKID